MGVKRLTYRFRKNDIIEVHEYHDGNYGGPGKGRVKKRKPTPEQMDRVNALNKERRCRHKLLEYFTEDDIFATLTYRKEERPADMQEALKDFKKVIGKIRKEYKKRGRELFWIRNIERGTKGGWHIHLVVNDIGDTASIVNRIWRHGQIRLDKISMDERVSGNDFSKLAAYITKTEKTPQLKKDGTPAKPRIKESSYSTSRNMPLPEPKVDRLVRWKETEKIKPKKGYVITALHEGRNPITGHPYRRYTEVAVNKPKVKRRI